MELRHTTHKWRGSIRCMSICEPFQRISIHTQNTKGSHSLSHIRFFEPVNMCVCLRNMKITNVFNDSMILLHFSIRYDYAIIIYVFIHHDQTHHSTSANHSNTIPCVAFTDSKSIDKCERFM